MNKRKWRGSDDRSRAAGKKCYYKNKEKRLAYSKTPEVVERRRQRYLAKSIALGRKPKFPIPDNERGARWRNLLQGAQYRAKKRGLDFNLTSAWALSEYTGHCAITGLPFVMPAGKRGPDGFAPSIDRIDASKGYIIGNCRFILFAINSLKGTLSDREMVDIARRIVGALGPSIDSAVVMNETDGTRLFASGAPATELLNRTRA